MRDQESDIKPVRLSTASGRYAIAAIALFAIGGAAFNWWYQRELHRRSIELWGAASAQLIVEAPEAEALRLAPADTTVGDALTAAAAAQPAEIVEIDGKMWTIVDRHSIKTPELAPGSSYVRRSLVNDKSFDWIPPADDCEPNWQYGLRFTSGEQVETYVISLDCPRVIRLGPAERRASVRPVVPAWKEFFGERFPEQGSPSAAQ